MKKRGVTVLLTVLLAVCLLGIEGIKEERREALREVNADSRTGGESLADGGESTSDGTEPEEKLAALTFDDGPHESCTPKLLMGLRERNVKATFFLIGKSIAGKEEIVKKMAEDGHLIGSHTFSHVQLTKLSVEEACREITMTNEAIYTVTGQQPEYIRPPYGSWDSELECAVNMKEVGWTVDPRDWDVKNTDAVVKRVLEKVEDGSIILLHDVYDTSVEAAFRIIDELKAQGYTFVTVDRLLLD